MSNSVTEMARAMTSARPKFVVHHQLVVTLVLFHLATVDAGIFPEKIVNLRANYLQQIRDLHSLFENGVITEFQEH